MLTYRIHSFAGDAAEDGGGFNPGRFELTTTDDGNYLKFENPYFDVGGRTYVSSSASSGQVPGDFSGVVALEVTMTGAVPVGEIATFADVGEMQNAQKDYEKYVIPLYLLSEGSVVCDFRLGPPAVAWEFSG